MNEYEIECTSRYEGTYTVEEIELNNQLYTECSKEVLDCETIEELLKKGADPLGATAVSGWGLLEHIYDELVCDSQDSRSVNLPKITELFLKYGMDVAKPKVPYDGDNSLHPMWSFSFIPNENAIIALKMLLDNRLDADSAGEFWGHSMFDQINVHRENPNDPEYTDWFVWTFKMLMLIVSYDHILNKDEDLRRRVGASYNQYDTHKFREWDNYRYEFDTSRCERYPELYRSVVRIFEIVSNKEVWRIGVSLKEGEF
ncbi:MAG: hypothetical protein IKK58_01455 [Clostridia bacterium]|nr:hypothetical protein [Clostridia bacterium]